MEFNVAVINLDYETNTVSLTANTNQQVTFAARFAAVKNNATSPIYLAIDRSMGANVPATIGGDHCVEINVGESYVFSDNVGRTWSINLISPVDGKVGIGLGVLG